MPENVLIYAAVYLAVASLWAIGLTAFDKRAARHESRRIKERTLLLISIIGGSVAMFVTMQAIRHKTKHAKFMIGIPVIIIAQIAAGFFVWQWLKGG